MEKGRPLGPLIRLNRWREPRASEITSESLFLRRREFLTSSALAATAVAWPGLAACKPEAPQLAALESTSNAALSTDEPLTDHADATTYNNFYEFGTDKGDASEASGIPAHKALDGRSRGRGRQAGHAGIGRSAQASRTRGAHLPASLCRSLVDGDPLDWNSTRRRCEALRAHLARQVRLVSNAPRSGTDARSALACARLALLRSPCASTRPRIHWRSSVSGCTGRSCPIRTGRRCAW